MKLSDESIAKYEAHMRRVDKKFENLKVSIVNGVLLWVPILEDTQTEVQPIEKPKPARAKKVKIEKEHKPLKLRKKRKKGKIDDAVRLIVIERDGYRCATCGVFSDLEVHHIVPRSKGGTDDTNNLTALCELCHYKTHKFEPVGNIMRKRLAMKGYKIQ